MQPVRLKWLLILCAIAGMGMSAMVGCTLVSDSVTGVSISKGRNATKCLEKCREKAEWRTFRELAKHLKATEHCREHKEADKRNACLAAEDARHEAALKRIDARRLECSNRCHHQQGGGGKDHDDDDDDDDKDDRKDDGTIAIP